MKFSSIIFFFVLCDTYVLCQYDKKYFQRRMHQRSRSLIVGDPAPRTWKKSYFCISMLTRSLPENQVWCQQAAVVVMQLGHTTIDTLTLFRIERGLVGEPELRTSKIAIYL